MSASATPRPGPGPGPGPDPDRGQTLVDFVVGIAIFLVTITLVVQFIPQLLLPYEGQERPVVAQRAATDLGDRLLAAPEPPSTLNRSCTIAFFNRSGGAACPFDTADPVHAQLGVDATYSVNVTLRDAPSDDPDSALLCDDGGSVTDCDAGDSLAVGPPVPETDRSVAIARRRVVVDDTDAVIEVGVW